MSVTYRSQPPMSRPGRWLSAVVLVAVTLMLLVTGPLARVLPAYAVTTAPALGATTTFSVLGGTGVSNSGITTLSNDLGVAPGGAIAGTPITVGGTTHNGNATAAQAASDLTAAYNDAAGRTPTTTFGGDQNAITFFAGVHQTNAAFALTGTMTLDAQGDPNAVFIFQVNAALNTAAGSTVALTNGARASRVFWQVSGALGTGASSAFVGTVLAIGAITIGASATVVGRLLSNGLVTLSSNSVSLPACSVAPTTTGPPPPGPAAVPAGPPGVAPDPARPGWWDTSTAALTVTSGSLAPATGLGATLTGTTATPTVTLTWTPTVTGYATGYRVFRDTSTGTFTQLATVLGRTTSTTVDSTVGSGVTYTYYLAAYVSSWTASSGTVTITTTGSC